MLKKFMKRVINGALRPVGLEISKIGEDPFWTQSQLVKEEKPTIFDVGAASGTVVEIYRNLFAQGTIHAFEPFPDAFRAMEARFGADRAVKLNQVAVSDMKGSVALHANWLAATNSILETDPRGDGLWGDGYLATQHILEVPTVTIDGYCEENKIERIDILKLDIQGAEYQALRGASSMLGEGRVGIVYMEVILAPSYVGQPSFEDYLRLFRDYGYTMLNMYNNVRRGARLIQSDLIFVAEAALSDV